MTKITFGIVAYKEEALIARCLASIRDVADEIILVHDGPAEDRTLEIAEGYGAQVHVGERQYGSDPHRIFILNQAKNDWVFMIDADEFLSAELKEWLAAAIVDPTCGAYSFLWPLWDGERYVTMSNYRATLFYKPKTWAIGLHNYSLQTVGPGCKKPLVLEHQPEQNKVSFARFSGQLAKRLDRDAKQFLLGYDGLDKYNEALIPDAFTSWLADYLAHPRRHAMINLPKYFLATWRSNWRDGYYGFVVSIQAAYYQYKLGMKIASLTKDRDNI